VIVILFQLPGDGIGLNGFSGLQHTSRLWRKTTTHGSKLF